MVVVLAKANIRSVAVDLNSERADAHMLFCTTKPSLVQETSNGNHGLCDDEICKVHRMLENTVTSLDMGVLQGPHHRRDHHPNPPSIHSLVESHGGRLNWPHAA